MIVRRTPSFLLYFVTSAAMYYTAYTHLDFAAKGIGNVSWGLLGEDIPVLFLLSAASLLCVSSITSLFSLRRAAQFAFIAALVGWVYYFVHMCILAPIFIMGLTTGLAVFQLLIPAMLLMLTTWLSREAMSINKHTNLLTKRRAEIDQTFKPRT